MEREDVLQSVGRKKGQTIYFYKQELFILYFRPWKKPPLVKSDWNLILILDLKWCFYPGGCLIGGDCSSLHSLYHPPSNYVSIIVEFSCWQVQVTVNSKHSTLLEVEIKKITKHLI